MKTISVFYFYAFHYEARTRIAAAVMHRYLPALAKREVSIIIDYICVSTA